MTFVTTSTSPFLASERVAGIVHAPTELTVVQAAEFLCMSERHLNDLLDAGRIAFRQESGQRLIQKNRLLDYERELERRHAAFDEFVRMNQEMGLYDD